MTDEVHQHNAWLCPAHVSPDCGCPDKEGWLCNPYYQLGYCPEDIDSISQDEARWRPDEAPSVDLLDDVWCLTCNHEHLATIPVVTFRCATGCGFGAWSDEVAEAHATSYPDHIVYPEHHQTVPLP